MRRSSILLLLLFLGGPGCGNDFNPRSYLSGLRVLAVRAMPPEVGPGQTAQLDVLSVDTRGRPVDFAWAVCRLPPIPGGSSVRSECATTDTAPFLEQLGGGSTKAVTMPNVAPTDLGPPDYTNGFYLPVRLRAETTAGDPQRVTSIYRLRYALGTPPNQNPRIADVAVVQDGQAVPLVEGQPLPVRIGAKITLRATLAAGSVETYQVYSGDPRTTPPETVTETVSVDWFAPAGDFENNATGEAEPDNTLDLGQRPPSAGATIDLFVMAHDERGGIDWAHRTLVAQ
ncbi:MAG TPA: hypothetical protein VH877_08220 [Polyangia bacterium]|jgi:hypothetical protein|nr:hypothetical protein [Polyangia bacterium]